MSISQFELPLFTNILILFVTARLFGELLERFKQPAMIGEILAGILWGPTILNLIHRTNEIQVISDLGIFLLVIMVGLEINIESILKSIRGKNIFIILLAFFLPLFGGILVGYYFNLGNTTALFIGLCISITALPISIRILMDLGKLHTDVGQAIISIAIFEDVMALTLLGAILNFNNGESKISSIAKTGSIALFKLFLLLFSLSLIYLLIKKISRKENYFEDLLNQFIGFLKGKESLFALFFAFVMLFATFTESLGLHFIIGAFFASLLISDNLIGKNNLAIIENSTRNMAMGFLAPIFFAGIGLEFNFSSISHVGLLLTVLAVSYLTKILGGYVGGKITGMSQIASLTIGVGLNARGIMELVIANIAYKTGMINLEIFSILILMGVLTTLTTPILLKRCFIRLEKLNT